MSEKLLKLILGFGVTVFVARYLGSEAYGKLNYVISFVSLFAPFYIFGTEEITIKKLLGQHSYESSQVLTSSLIVKLIGGVISLGIIIIASQFLAPSWAVNLIALYALFFFSQIFITFHHYFFSLNKAYIGTGWKILALILTSLLKLLCIQFHYGWSFFIYISCLEIFLFGIIHIFTFIKFKEINFAIKINAYILKDLLRKGFPVFLFLLFDQAMQKLDQIMVGNILGEVVLGQYAIANKLVNLWSFLPLMILSLLLPKIISSHKNGTKEFEQIIKAITGGFLGITLSFGFLVLLISKPLVIFLYGDQYSMGAEILAVFAWLPIIQYFILLRSKIFIVTGELFSAIILSLATVSLNVVLNLFLIPEFGAFGAIYSTFAAFFITLVIFSLKNKTTWVTSKIFLKSPVTLHKEFFNFLKLLS